MDFLCNFDKNIFFSVWENWLCMWQIFTKGYSSSVTASQKYLTKQTSSCINKVIHCLIMNLQTTLNTRENKSEVVTIIHLRWGFFVQVADITCNKKKYPIEKKHKIEKKILKSWKSGKLVLCLFTHLNLIFRPNLYFFFFFKLHEILCILWYFCKILKD